MTCVCSLDDVVIVNESPDERIAGDVSIYPNEMAMCDALEHWWVADREGFAFTASGVRLILDHIPDGAVFVVRRETCEGGAALVRTWLTQAARARLAAHRSPAGRGGIRLSPFDEQGRLPTDTADLIDYLMSHVEPGPRAGAVRPLVKLVLLTAMIAGALLLV